MSRIQVSRGVIPRLYHDIYELEFVTAVPVDNQFSGTNQIRWSSALGKLLVGNTNNRWLYRNSDLSFFSKYYIGNIAAVDADANNTYVGGSSSLHKRAMLGDAMSPAQYIAITGIRMIDASGDPDYVYVTSNNATDGHGVRKVRKSDMTVVASLLATGSGYGQFNNPLGVKYWDGFVYVADYTNKRIVKLNATGANLTFDSVAATLLYSPQDLDTDGTNWWFTFSTGIYMRDFVFTAPSIANNTCDCYSICIIPDQGDGNGQTLAIVNSTNSHLARYKCSNLSLINEVGSAGTGADTLCDPVVTGPAGVWFDSEGGNYAVASAANISKNGFSGDFFRGTPNKLVYRITGGKSLKDITAIDANTDAIQGEIRNLYRCTNLTSLKLQANTALLLDLGRLSAKLQTLWAYGCGPGIAGSIRHMTALTSVNLRENGASQAQVDAWVEDLWANKDILTTPTINMNGTNAAPSGVYQYAETPSTPKEKIYFLINNYMWTFVYTT